MRSRNDVDLSFVLDRRGRRSLQKLVYIEMCPYLPDKLKFEIADAHGAPLPVCVCILLVSSRDVWSSNFDLSVSLNTAKLMSIGHPERTRSFGSVMK